MSPYSTPEHRQLLHAWDTANRDLLNHPTAANHPACAFPGQRHGCPDWLALDEIVNCLETQMQKQGLPHPGNIHLDDN